MSISGKGQPIAKLKIKSFSFYVVIEKFAVALWPVFGGESLTARIRS